MDAGQILGPLPHRPLENFEDLWSGEGCSINNYISREFFLHYSTIDNAVAQLGRFDRGTLTTKLDLQVAGLPHPHGPYLAL